MAHSSNDSWKEERKGVKWGVDADGDQHVDVNFPVFDGVEEILRVELICQASPIELQTTVDFILLLLSKKLCCFGVVIDNPVRGGCCSMC